MSADFQVLFDQLVSERGGKQALGVVGLSIARSLSVALSDPATPPSVVANLSASLPPKMEPDEANYDLRNLSTAELRQLDYLLGRAAGSKEPKPPRIRRSRREEDALEAAQFIDRIARRDKKPTDSEMIQIRNYVHYLISPVTYPDELYACLAGSRPAPTVALPTATQPASSAPKTENVVALMRPGHH